MSLLRKTVPAISSIIKIIHCVQLKSCIQSFWMHLSKLNDCIHRISRCWCWVALIFWLFPYCIRIPLCISGFEILTSEGMYFETGIFKILALQKIGLTVVCTCYVNCTCSIVSSFNVASACEVVSTFLSLFYSVKTQQIFADVRMDI